MNKILELIKTKKFNYFFIIFLILIGSLTLFVNKGFYFFELKEETTFSLKSEDQKELSALINSLTLKNNVSKISLEQAKVSFQNIASEEAKVILKNEIGEKKITFSFITQLQDQRSIATEFGFFLVLALLGFFATSFYLGFKFNKTLSLKSIGKFYMSYLLTVLLSNFLSIALLSLISRVYQIKVIDLIFIIISTLWISIIYYWAVMVLKNDENLSIEKIFQNITNQLKYRARKHMILFSALLFIVSFGFGINFVPTAVIYALSSVILIYISSILVMFFESITLTRKKTVKVENVKKKRIKMSNKFGNL